MVKIGISTSVHIDKEVKGIASFLIDDTTNGIKIKDNENGYNGVVLFIKDTESCDNLIKAIREVKYKLNKISSNPKESD